jgi:hypothetical protein
MRKPARKPTLAVTVGEHAHLQDGRRLGKPPRPVTAEVAPLACESPETRQRGQLPAALRGRAQSHARRPRVAAGQRRELIPKKDRDDAPAEVCPFCCRPCVGPKDGWYRITHWHDPKEVTRRAAERAKREEFDRKTWDLHNQQAVLSPIESGSPSTQEENNAF